MPIIDIFKKKEEEESVFKIQIRNEMLHAPPTTAHVSREVSYLFRRDNKILTPLHYYRKEES